MAVGIRITFTGLGQEEFDRAHEGINPDRTAPQGLLFHASGPVEDGWEVIDFWESRDDFDAFFASSIQSGMASSGVQPQGPPAVSEFPVHEYIER